jgi:hypothetical protein
MFLELVKNQQIEGYWFLNEENIKLINENEKDILDKIPKQLENLNSNVKLNLWFTILALKWIEHYFPKDKDSLRLIIKKASQWLIKNGIDYKVLKSEAESYFIFNEKKN